MYWFGKHFLAKIDVADRKHGRRHLVGNSHEGIEDQDADRGAGVVNFGLGKRDQSETEVVVLSS